MMKTRRRPPPRKPRTELVSAAEHRRRHLPGLPFKAAADPEVRAFIDTGLDTMTFKELAAAARGRFGPERAPSRSAIFRYWQHRHAARIFL